MTRSKERIKAAKIFAALGHPRRLEILELLEGWAHSPTELAKRFDCSWPAISKHLDVLLEAGLIERYEAEYGRGYAYVTRPETREEARTWLAEFTALDPP